MNKYHIVPLWTGSYFSDTWGCQAAAVHHSGNLRSLPWSLWPEFLRRQWKKIVKSALLLSLGRKRTRIFACWAWEVVPVEGFGLAAGESQCGALVWWLWLPRGTAEVRMAAHSCKNVAACTRCRCSRLARHWSGSFLSHTWITRLPWPTRIVHLAFKNVLLHCCKTSKFCPGKICAAVHLWLLKTLDLQYQEIQEWSHLPRCLLTPGHVKCVTCFCWDRGWGSWSDHVPFLSCFRVSPWFQKVRRSKLDNEGNRSKWLSAHALNSGVCSISQIEHECVNRGLKH